MSGTTARAQQEPEINWALPLSLARNILSILAKQPYEQISPVIQFLEQQGNEQLQRLQGAGNPMMQQRPNGEDEQPPPRLPS